MGPEINLEIVHRGYEAEGRGDFARAVERFASDIEWQWSGPSLHGPEEIRRVLESLAPLAETHNEIERLAATGNYVLVRKRFSMQWKASAFISGRRPPRESRVFDLWTLSEGRVIRYQALGRRAEVLRVVGLFDAIRLRRAL